MISSNKQGHNQNQLEQAGGNDEPENVEDMRKENAKMKDIILKQNYQIEELWNLFKQMANNIRRIHSIMKYLK